MNDPGIQTAERATPDRKNHFYLFAIFYLFFLLLTSLGNDFGFLPASREAKGVYHALKIDGGDDAAYFAYLRSLFFDHDLDFFNEPYYIHSRSINATGYVFNQWKVGPALLWLPFFTLAHLLTKFYNLIGIPLSQDGLSFIYFSSTALGSAAYAYLGLVLHCRILRHFFTAAAARGAALVFFLATPLIYFTFIRSRMAHASDYFLTALFIYGWLRFRAAPAAANGTALGLCGGLMLLTRVNSACFLLLPLYDGIAAVYARRAGAMPRALLPYACVFAACLCVFSLQLNVNHILGKGQSQLVEAMLFAPGNWERLLTRPFTVLLGADWGLLWHAPVYPISLPALFFFAKNQPAAGRPLLLAIAAPIYLALIWPHNGMSYGYRHLLTINIPLSLGAAYAYDCLSNPRLKTAVIFLTVLPLVFWSYLQLCLYMIVIPYDSSSFILQAAQSLSIFFALPSLLLRGENIFYLFFHPEFAVKTYQDVYLLFIFPVLNGATPLILLFTGSYIWDRIRRHSESGTAWMWMANSGVLLFILALNLWIYAENGKKTPEFAAQRRAEALANPVDLDVVGRAARAGGQLALPKKP